MNDKRNPYPYFLEKKDSLYILFNNSGIPIDSCFLADSLLAFKAHKYKIVESLNDELKVYDLALFRQGKAKYDSDYIVFRKCKKKAVDKKQLADLLQNNAWTFNRKHPSPNEDFLIKNYLLFSGDTLFQIREYLLDSLLHREFEQFKYEIIELNNSTFISILDIDNNTENKLPIHEINAITESEIIWINHRNLKPTEEILRSSPNLPKTKVENLKSEANHFNLCYDGLQLEYYYKKGYYVDGSKGFLRDINNKFSLEEDLNANGYIIFQFYVNCDGNLGRYGLLQMDNNFKAIKFNPTLVTQLFKILNASSSRWIVDIEQGEHRAADAKDVYGFLMFKIKNGQVTEVLP